MAKIDKSSTKGAITGAVPAECAAVLVYTTFPDLASAETVGRSLVADRLAGCINILPGMVSIYQWKGVLERADEVVLIAKTAAERAEACLQAVVVRHPYETPAALVLPVAAGSAAYLDWIVSGSSPLPQRLD